MGGTDELYQLEVALICGSNNRPTVIRPAGPLYPPKNRRVKNGGKLYSVDQPDLVGLRTKVPYLPNFAKLN